MNRYAGDAHASLHADIASHYLRTNEDSLRRLVDLAADLAWLKDWELAVADAESAANE